MEMDQPLAITVDFHFKTEEDKLKYGSLSFSFENTTTYETVMRDLCDKQKSMDYIKKQLVRQKKYRHVGGLVILGYRIENSKSEEIDVSVVEGHVPIEAIYKEGERKGQYTKFEVHVSLPGRYLVDKITNHMDDIKRGAESGIDSSKYAIVQTGVWTIGRMKLDISSNFEQVK